MALRAVEVALMFAVLVTETPDHITSMHLLMTVMETTVNITLFYLVVVATEVSSTMVTIGLKTSCRFGSHRPLTKVFIII